MQLLRALIEKGEEASTAYVHSREQIERMHGAEDGTEIHYERQHGDRREYKETADPITEQTPASVLNEYGVNQRDINQLDRHDCFTLADVRVVLRNRDILAWEMCGVVMEQRVKAAMERIDGR
jgi:nicotinamidase-related amidase